MDSGWTCPVARAARVLGDACILLIVRDLGSQPRYFGELLGSVCGNTRTLSARLKRLTALGLIERHHERGHPPRVQYHLTERGRDLLPAIDVLRAFGERWLPAGCDPLAVAAHRDVPGASGSAPAAPGKRAAQTTTAAPRVP